MPGWKDSPRLVRRHRNPEEGVDCPLITRITRTDDGARRQKYQGFPGLLSLRVIRVIRGQYLVTWNVRRLLRDVTVSPRSS